MRQVPHNEMARFSIYGIIFFITAGFTINFPVLTFLCFDKQSTLFAPDIDHATRSFWYGISNAIPQFIAIFAAPILSLISDFCGRRIIFIIAAAGTFASSLFIVFGIFAANLTWFVIGLAVIGLCTRVDPIAVAATGDISPKQNLLKNMAYLQCSIALGALLGPLLGGFMGQLFIPTFRFSLPHICGIFFGIALFLIIIFYWKQEETQKTKIKFSALLVDLRHLLSSRNVRTTSILLILTQITWRTYYQFMPPLLKINLHYSPAIIGYFLASLALWLSSATFFIFRWLVRFFNLATLTTICLGTMLCGASMAIIGSYINNLNIAAFFLWGSGLPIATGDVIIFSIITSMYIHNVGAQHHGKVMALCFLIVSLIWAITGFFGGLLAGINIHLPMCCAIFGVIAALIWKKFLIREVK